MSLVLSLVPEDIDPDLNSMTRRLLVHHRQLSDTLCRFQKRWHSEYLRAFRAPHQSPSRSTVTPELNVDDLVMLKVDERNRLNWPLVWITKLLPDAEGVVRTVELLSKGSIVKRSVSHLVPLEV